MFDPTKFYRFSDIKASGLAPNWPTLRRWQAKLGFPPGTLMGENSRVWTGKELNEYVRSRPVGPAPLRGIAKRGGRQ